VVTTENEAESSGALKVSDDAFSGFPMRWTIRVEELAELLDCIRDIGAGAYGQVH
jgi:hypothetical protein